MCQHHDWFGHTGRISIGLNLIGKHLGKVFPRADLKCINGFDCLLRISPRGNKVYRNRPNMSLVLLNSDITLNLHVCSVDL